MGEINQLRYGQLQTAMIKLGHRFFEEGDYNLNLIGVRNADLNSNAFNDSLAVVYRVNGRPHCHVFPATTDPGTYWRERPANVSGTAIVKPGQYPQLWEIGKHQGKYSALVQVGNVTVYRDNDKDSALTLGKKTETGILGINCHKAGLASRRVDKWSAGCQVLANEADFNLLMSLCDKASELWGNRFTYTLINEGDL